MVVDTTNKPSLEVTYHDRFSDTFGFSGATNGLLLGVNSHGPNSDHIGRSHGYRSAYALDRFFLATFFWSFVGYLLEQESLYRTSPEAFVLPLMNRVTFLSQFNTTQPNITQSNAKVPSA